MQDLSTPGAKLEPFLDAFDASYTVVGNDGPTFYVLTDQDAPRGRLVAIELGLAAAADVEDADRRGRQPRRARRA